MEQEQNGYSMGMERIQNGYRTGTCAERKQNAFCQAFPVRFLLISTVHSFVSLSCLCSESSLALLFAICVRM